jgi:peptidyl-prolyl cis-trans isomerase C
MTRLAVRAHLCCALLASGLVLGAPIAHAQNAAVVNGKPIPSKRVDEFVEALKAQGRPDSPELRSAVREELITREIFAQEAEKIGLGRQPEVQRQLEQARQQILIQALMREHMRKNPVREEAVKAEYERLKASSGGQKEYRARHILVDQEDAASKIIADLKKGAKFEDLAKQSKDTGSAANGGDLDWNVPGTFVKEFGEAMVKLEKGKFTETPVKTQFGYHVIRLDDVRDVQPPPYDQVHPQLQQEMERKVVQKLQQDLRARAKVE